MRVGVVILPEERWWSAQPKWELVDELGFDHAWTYDHLGWRNLVDGPWFAAMPTLTAAAMATERIQLGTFVASPNFRHPVPFAREVLNVDDVSDGRLLLGIGAGTPPPAYDTVVMGDQALTPRRRTDRFAEFVTALDGLLRIDGYDFAGEYFQAAGARNLPGSVRMPRTPFVIAANGPRTLRLAARFGQGWVTTGANGADADGWWQSLKELSTEFDQALDGAGRDPAGIRRYLSIDAGPTYGLTSVDTFTDAAERAHRLGFTDVIVHWPRSTEPYLGHEDVLTEVAETTLADVQGL